jgi:hypothetical protein
MSGAEMALSGQKATTNREELSNYRPVGLRAAEMERSGFVRIGARNQTI